MKLLALFGLLTLLSTIVAADKGENITSRIVNGNQVTHISQAPYHVAILVDDEYSCGGVLFTEDTIITTANCIKEYVNHEKRLKIRYGSIDRTNDRNEILVYKITIHENYNPKTLDYDLAILRLVAVFDSSTGAKVIGLTNQKPKAGESLYLTGWGRNGATGQMAPRLSYTFLQMETLKTCRKSWAGQKQISDNEFCAYSPRSGSCMGDQGSPITYQGRLLGVLSYQPVGCLDDILPSVYTDLTITHIQNWISKHTSSDI